MVVESRLNTTSRSIWTRSDGVGVVCPRSTGWATHLWVPRWVSGETGNKMQSVTRHATQVRLPCLTHREIEACMSSRMMCTCDGVSPG